MDGSPNRFLGRTVIRPAPAPGSDAPARIAARAAPSRLDLAAEAVEQTVADLGAGGRARAYQVDVSDPRPCGRRRGAATTSAARLSSTCAGIGKFATRSGRGLSRIIGVNLTAPSSWYRRRCPTSSTAAARS
jgi:hypothetical protein